MSREGKSEHECGERAGVDRRFSHSESNPVRQISNQKVCEHSSNWISGNYGWHKNRGYRKVVELLEREMVSFFFRNFIAKCSLEVLKAWFNEVGRVVDIFCPKK
ncbi:hypothetical protein ACS0TY_020590 [Phlomoides rotata]